LAAAISSWIRSAWWDDITHPVNNDNFDVAVFGKLGNRTKLIHQLGTQSMNLTVVEEAYVETNRQLEEALSWRLVTELWRRFPNRFFLIETHPGGGQYDCLSLIERNEDFHGVFDVNRSGGSAHLHQGRTPQSWSDWVDRMLSDPRGFLDDVGKAYGLAAPKSLPKSTPSTISFRYACEILTHAVGRLEYWECRNGFCDTSGWQGGKQDSWFACFPAIANTTPPKVLEKRGMDGAYGYWFLLKDSTPVLCFDIEARLYKLDGNIYDLAVLYDGHERIWPVIAETAMDLLP
jgi:hypothetical protein